MSETYQVEALDQTTRDYLLQVGRAKGEGMPGIFTGSSSSLPAWGMIFGILILGATFLVGFPPMGHPAAEAMLQTAGLMTGGWMILAAIRTWMARASGKNLGHFTYVDSCNMYEVAGSTVKITDIHKIREARAVQNFNQGSYQNTAITIRLKGDEHLVTVKNEQAGQEMTVFLNALAYARGGGENGDDEDLKNLSASQMGYVTREVAETGNFPSNYVANRDGGVPVPEHPGADGRGSSGMLAILVILAVGAGMIFGLTKLNSSLRDDAIFERLDQIPNAKDKAYWLRLYLNEPKFTKHRVEVQQILDRYYDEAVGKVMGTDADLKKGMVAILEELKKLPQPVVSLQAVETKSPAVASDKAIREDAVRKGLADWLGSHLGDHLIVFATLQDAEAKAMIDVRWEHTVPAAGGVPTVKWTMEFRPKPDGEPMVVKTETFLHAAPFGMDPQMQGRLVQSKNESANFFTAYLLKRMVGEPGVRPFEAPQIDF